MKYTDKYKCNECGEIWSHEWDTEDMNNDFTQCPKGCDGFDFEDVAKIYPDNMRYGEDECTHKKTTPHFDYVQCNDCGSVLCHLLGSRKGMIARDWFPSLVAYQEYKKTGVRK